MFLVISRFMNKRKVKIAETLENILRILLWIRITINYIQTSFSAFVLYLIKFLARAFKLAILCPKIQLGFRISSIDSGLAPIPGSCCIK